MITAVIIAKNEEKNIVECLAGLYFCDEILVVDDYSDDNTVKLAISKGARVVRKKLENNFSAQRNYALTLAKNEWVLFVDADERVGKDLGDEIQKKIKENSKDGYFIKREDKLFGKILKYGELRNKKFLRLGKAGKWKGAVHEVWDIPGSIGVLQNSLLHMPHQSLSEFISELNFYTTLRAQELYKQGVRSSWYSILLYTKGKFFYTYIIKLGFLDGVPGLLVSMMMTMHSFLTRSKLYLLSRQ